MRPIVHHLTCLLASVVLPLAASAQAAPNASTNATPLRVAVLDFSNGTPVAPEQVEPLRRALGATLAGALVRSGRAQVVERNRLNALLDEQDLARSGRIDDATAARIGKLLGADYLFLGAFIVQPNGEMLVSTRLVDVATAVVTAGPDLVGDRKSATKLMDRLSDAIAKQLRLPGDLPEFKRVKRADTKDSPELSAAIDALARGCDRKDAAAVATARAEIVKRAPDHPALGAPCY